MIDLIIDAILDGVLDTVKIIPFLYLTYLLMEILEHRTGDKTLAIIRKADRMGPLFGGALGILPQCGFSAAASGFYAGRVITAGTLIAIFLSTSDEMLPILISSQIPVRTIIQILLTKAVIGIIFGFAVDFIFRRFNIRLIGGSIHDLCEHDHCNCDDEPNVLISALRHCLQIVAFLFIVSVVLNFVIMYIGEDTLKGFILNQPLIGELITGVIGLIPNCAASVVITELYLEGAMSAGAMMSGLLVGAGIGLLVLFRTNRNLRENIQLTVLLYICGVLGGLAVDLLGVVF